jgi:hypothetical protein
LIIASMRARKKSAVSILESPRNPLHLDLNPREIISKIQAENLAFMRAGGTLQGRLTNCAVSDAGFPRASLALVAGPRGLEAYLPGRCRDIWSRRSSRSTGGAKRSIARASANEPLKPYANDCIE